MPAILSTGSLKTAATDSAVRLISVIPLRHLTAMRYSAASEAMNSQKIMWSLRKVQDSIRMLLISFVKLKYSGNRNMATMRKAVLPCVPKAVTMEVEARIL